MAMKMERKRILIVAPFCSLPGEPYFNRFLFLADFLSSSFDVTLLTSSFRHFDKMQRVGRVESERFEIVLINEPGYKANVGMMRLYSHYIFSRNFSKWMDQAHRYDVVYSAYPLIQTNIILSKLKAKFGFKLVVDVQDVWPEAISALIPVVSKVSPKLVPFYSKANKAYSAADALVAVSKTYLDRALSARNTCVPHEVVYLGSSLGSLDIGPVKNRSDGVFRLTYLGTLSYSYDVDTVMIGVSALVGQGYNVELHILGGGPFEEKLKAKAGEGIYFHGFLSFDKAIDFVRRCDVAVNPIVRGAPQSVTNKISDYLALGIPVLNSQESPEVRALLDSVDHEHYRSGSVADFKAAVLRIYGRREFIKFKPNSLFVRGLQYERIRSLLDRLLDMR
jgi:glycosyltransferase involved in cell wall biosynthesis